MVKEIKVNYGGKEHRIISINFEISYALITAEKEGFGGRFKVPLKELTIVK